MPLSPCLCHPLLVFIFSSLGGWRTPDLALLHSPAAVGGTGCERTLAGAGSSAAICAPVLDSRVSSWQVQKFSIIAVSECICKVVQNRRIVILLNIEV